MRMISTLEWAIHRVDHTPIVLSIPSSHLRPFFALTSRLFLRGPLQEAIVSQLHWTSLRPVQELAGEALLDGKNAVVLAPTAGGKTEAAMFPALANLMASEPDGVGVIYIAPIKALLNNQEDRLGTYAEMVGLRRFVWHGDVAEHERKKFKDEPTEILMTTPESLEVMLVSPRFPVARVFKDLRMGLSVPLYREVPRYQRRREPVQPSWVGRPQSAKADPTLGLPPLRSFAHAVGREGSRRAPRDRRPPANPRRSRSGQRPERRPARRPGPRRTPGGRARRPRGGARRDRPRGRDPSRRPPCQRGCYFSRRSRRSVGLDC